MQHHLILVREIDQQMSGSGCCGRLEGDLVYWSDEGCVFNDRREKMNRVGAIYRAVRENFQDRIEITIVDPRNFVSFLPLVARDAMRFGVPWLDAARAMFSTSLSTAVFDGQLLYRGEIPTPGQVVDLVRSCLQIDRVGAPRPTPV